MLNRYFTRFTRRVQQAGKAGLGDNGTSALMRPLLQTSGDWRRQAQRLFFAPQAKWACCLFLASAATVGFLRLPGFVAAMSLLLFCGIDRRNVLDGMQAAVFIAPQTPRLIGRQRIIAVSSASNICRIRFSANGQPRWQISETVGYVVFIATPPAWLLCVHTSKAPHGRLVRRLPSALS